MENQQSEARWYAIQTLSNQESKVVALIKKSIEDHNLSKFIEEFLLPSESISEVRNGKKYSRVRKFYPGYVFIKMQMYDENGEVILFPWQTIKAINGVVTFIGGNRPIALTESEIAGIRDQVSAVEGKVNPKVNFEAGDMVKITDGPFLNLTGIVEDIDTGSGTLKVQVAMFGRMTSVDLEFWQVKRFDESE